MQDIINVWFNGFQWPLNQCPLKMRKQNIQQYAYGTENILSNSPQMEGQSNANVTPVRY